MESSIMWNCIHLDANFSNKKYYIFDQVTLKTISCSVEDHKLSRLIDIGYVKEYALTSKSALNITTLQNQWYGHLTLKYLS